MSATTAVLLIDQIASDANVVAAVTSALAFAASDALDHFHPAASPPGFVNSRTYLDGVTYASRATAPYDFFLRNPGNQPHLINNYRYAEPVHLIISSAKKVDGGFRVNEKGPVTLNIVENCGQATMFPEDEVPAEKVACFWVLHETCERTRRMEIYIARPARLLEGGTLFLTTEFRPLFDRVLDYPVGAADAAAQGADLPQAEAISVHVAERTDAETFDDTATLDTERAP